jgi:hypothetical protein
MRWHGYRSENRYPVFQGLVPTLGWPVRRWRILDTAHRKRNLAEYEGFVEIDETAVAELLALVERLLREVDELIEKP